MESGTKIDAVESGAGASNPCPRAEWSSPLDPPPVSDLQGVIDLVETFRKCARSHRERGRDGDDLIAETWESAAVALTDRLAAFPRGGRTPQQREKEQVDTRGETMGDPSDSPTAMEKRS